MGLLNDLLTLYVASQGTCALTQEDTAFFVYNKPLETWDKEYPDKVAILLGNNVLVRSREELTPDVIKHELAHARQMRQYGGELVYRPLYLLSMLKAKILKGDTDKNPFEVEALAAEKK
jgi:hypothetical protein